jgi:Ca2+:H+ antiporter
MLTLAVISLVVPAGVSYLVGHDPSVSAKDLAGRESDLSFEISLVLLATYALSLLFSLKTHKQLFLRHLRRG